MEILVLLEEIRLEEMDIQNNLRITLIQDENTLEAIAQKLLVNEKNVNEINYILNYEDMISTSFKRSIGEKGLEYLDKEEISKQRSLVTYLIKQIGSSIMNGKSIMNISLPVYIFDHRSLLEAFSYLIKHLPNVLKDIEQENKIEQLKKVTTYIVSSNIYSLCMRKPFNPILGETFQAKVDDIDIYVEQTCHHPPIFNYLYLSPYFKGYGYSAVDITTGPNSITATNSGKLFLSLNDGTRYKIFPPKFVINGISLGKRTVNYSGNLVVQDQKNGLMAVIRFNPDDRSSITKFFVSKSNYADHITGFISEADNILYDKNNDVYSMIDQSNCLSLIDGFWSSEILFDSKSYWKQGDSRLLPMYTQSFTLPSDSRYREDLLLFKNGYEDLAQQAKTYLEEIQRKDRKLREQYMSSKK